MVGAWVAHLQKAGLTKPSVKQKLAAIRKFLVKTRPSVERSRAIHFVRLASPLRPLFRNGVERLLPSSNHQRSSKAISGRGLQPFQHHTQLPSPDFYHHRPL